MYNFYHNLTHCISLASSINAFVDAMKKNGEINEGVIFVPIRCAVSRYYNDKDDYEIGDSITLAFYSPSNYTKVGVVIPNEDGRTWPVMGLNVQIESDHDSCWRDGTNRILRSFFRNIENQVEKDDEHKRKCNIHADFDITGVKFYPYLEMRYVGDREERIAIIQKNQSK